MFNKSQVIGRLGRNPETKTFPNGDTVTTFSVATTDSWTDRETGERKEHTEWHNISVKGRFGQVCQQHLRQGSKVFVEGKLRTRSWPDKEHPSFTHVRTEIQAEEVKFLDDRGSSNNQNAEQNQGQSAPKAAPAGGGYGNQNNNQGGGYGNQNNNQGGGYGNQNNNQGGGYAGLAGQPPAGSQEDDIPF